MPSRRTFIKQASLAATGAILLKDNWFKKQQLIGLQLYTLRAEIQKDLEGTLARVAAIGYNSVELFGYGNGKFFGKTPDEFSAILKKNHLKTPSGHYMMMGFLTKGDQDDLKKTVADAARMGHDYIVIPFLFDNMRKSLEDYKNLAAKINVAGAEAKKAGLKLVYHNHNFEFKDWGGGQTGFDVFVKETDPSLVGFEMDIYWVERAGRDPIELIRQNPGRIKMWHVKDMSVRAEKSFTTDGEQYFTEVGSGVIDYKEIFRHKKESGMEYFFVEQDQTKIPVFDSITKSYQYLKGTILA
ncbi:MAG TPA: sugar phosphate isomerase/epimerase [Chitinophagaceae bacterium]|nr:sugar phosphate isomerase/epimerase [Chitinophagaceae bacterium]